MRGFALVIVSAFGFPVEGNQFLFATLLLLHQSLEGRRCAERGEAARLGRG
jgi:hypothetical protein